jgi:hypothetical protein
VLSYHKGPESRPSNTISKLAGRFSEKKNLFLFQIAHLGSIGCKTVTVC